MRYLDSQWRLSMRGCLFVFVEAYYLAAVKWGLHLLT